MSSQDRSDSTIEHNFSSLAHTEFERAEETFITFGDATATPGDATNSTEQTGLQHGRGSDASSTRTSIDTTRPFHEYHERNGVGETVGTTEPGETHAFLHENHPDAESIRKTKAKTKGNHVAFLMTWWLEAVSLALAIAALSAIVGIMAEYHDKQQPEWKYRINLNTVIAILSTLMRACVVVVAEEVISQLKWMLFRQPKPLQHLAHFDSASRGPWGSVLFLVRTRTLSTAFLGCMIIVFSVGIGPFAQQAAEAVPCDRPLEFAEATISISRWIHSFNIARLDPQHMDLDISTKIALVNGLANPNRTQSEITPGCSTGNCVFPSFNGTTHSSIGMCKRCADVTPWGTEILTKDRYENGSVTGYDLQEVILPGGHGIGRALAGSRALPKKILDVSGHGTIWKSAARRLNNSVFDKLDDSFDTTLRASVLNVTVMTFTDTGCEQGRCSNHSFNTSFPWLDSVNVVATACSFYLCIRDYHGSVRDTIFTEAVIRDTPILQPRGSTHPYANFEHFHTPCIIDGHAYTMDNISSVPADAHNFTTNLIDDVNVTLPADCAYQVDGAYASSFIDFMSTTLFGECIAPARVNFNGDIDDYNTLMCTPWYLKGLVNQGNASFQTIDHNMESVAVAITSEMRKQGTGWNMSLTDTIPIYAKGTVMQTTVCMKFKWMWLSFPLALIALTTLLLGVSCGKMYFDTRKIPACKSSVLPLLLTGNQIGAMSGAGNMEEIEANTDNLDVSLARLERGWEFVVEHYEARKKKDS